MSFEDYLFSAVLWSARFLDVLGAIIIIMAGVSLFRQATLHHFHHAGHRLSGVRLSLARSLALGLEFKLGGEILRTVVVRTMDEVIILGAIVFLRGFLNLIIHWEIKRDRDEIRDEEHR